MCDDMRIVIPLAPAILRVRRWTAIWLIFRAAAMRHRRHCYGVMALGRITMETASQPR